MRLRAFVAEYMQQGCKNCLFSNPYRNARKQVPNDFLFIENSRHQGLIGKEPLVVVDFWETERERSGSNQVTEIGHKRLRLPVVPLRP